MLRESNSVLSASSAVSKTLESVLRNFLRVAQDYQENRLGAIKNAVFHSAPRRTAQNGAGWRRNPRWSSLAGLVFPSLGRRADLLALVVGRVSPAACPAMYVFCWCGLPMIFHRHCKGGPVSTTATLSPAFQFARPRVSNVFFDTGSVLW